MSSTKKQSGAGSGSKKLTRSQRRAQQRRQKQMQNMALIAVGAIIIVVALIIPGLSQTPTDEVELPEIIVPTPREHPLADDNTMGDPNAPVVIEEFSDFQCSYCRDFFRETEPLIINEYIATGQVYFIYRSKGDFLGVESGRAMEAAYCAGDENKFWEMHDIIFANYSTGNSGGYSVKRLTGMAEAIGLDVNIFEDCLKDRKYRDRVEEDQSAAQEKGVQGTPAFFINDIFVEGNAPYDTFRAYIEAALSPQGD
jgi:protein-disulfide isomerase